MRISISPKNVGVIFSAKANKLKAVAPKTILKAATIAGGEIARSVFSNHGGGKGTLARSFLPAVFVSVPGKIAAGAHSDLVYAQIQDEGGTIKPRTAKNLAIPVGKVGVKWPRDYGRDKLFFMRGRSGKKLLVERVGRGKKIRVLYVLKPTVTLKGSNYIGEAADAAAPKIEAAFAAAVDEAVR